MDKTLLLKTFAVKENPGLSLVDPRFNELSTHIQSGDYQQVSTLAQEIISEEIYDIRVICYFLFGLFLEIGPGGFQEIFQSISKVFSENWDAVGPVKNKEKQVANSLNWLFKQLTRKIEYEEKKESPEWTKWQETADTDSVQAAMDLCDDLRKSVSQKLEDLAAHLVDGISNLQTWLTTFYRLIYKEPEPEPAAEEAPDSPDTASSDAGAAGAAVAAGAAGAADAPQAVAFQPVAYKGNYHLAQLQKKLAAFETLIKKEKFEQAALVAFDIDDIINHFDPRRYFPELFAKFSLLYSVNIKEMLTSKNYTETAEWQALKELYKVDIDQFAALDLDIDFSDAAADTGSDGGYDDGYGDDGYAD